MVNQSIPLTTPAILSEAISRSEIGEVEEPALSGVEGTCIVFPQLLDKKRGRNIFRIFEIMQMDESADRDRWNALYKAGSHTSLTPDQSFAELYTSFIEPRFPSGGKALDIAGGVGRNALWLASRGWRVVLNDLSDEAIHLAAVYAAETGMSLETRRESGAATLAWAKNIGLRFDLIVMLFYLDRALFPAMWGALAPEGVLVIKTRTEDHPRFAAGSSHPEYFLRQGELASAFPELRVLHASEEGGMAELVAQASALQSIA